MSVAAWTLDTSIGALYLSLTDGERVRQVVLGDASAIIDYGPDDRVVGIEILSFRGLELVLISRPQLNLDAADHELLDRIAGSPVARQLGRRAVVAADPRSQVQPRRLDPAANRWELEPA